MKGNALIIGEEKPLFGSVMHRISDVFQREGRNELISGSSSTNARVMMVSDGNAESLHT